MAGIDDLIAQGPGRREFTPLGELLGAYRDGLKASREDDIAQTRRSLGNFVGADGRPDFGAASLHLLRGGDLAGATALARLAWGRGGQAVGRNGPNVHADRPPEAEPDVLSYAPAAFTGLAPPTPVTMQPPFAAPAVRTPADANEVIRQARAARAEGRDPNLILKRMRQFGLGVSNY